MALLTALLLLAQPALPVIVRRAPARSEASQLEAEAQAPDAAPDTAPPAAPLPKASDLYGEWRIGLVRGGRSCLLRFHATGLGFGFQGLGMGANCPDGLFAANRWRLDDEVLVLAGRDGRPLVRLTRQEGGNWQGQRLGDGGILVMGRQRAAIVR
jgi:hypothetical protein